MTADITSIAAPLDRAFQIANQACPPKPRSGERVRVANSADIPEGGKVIVTPGNGPSIGIFRIDGNLYAIKNVCPHNGAPLCLGTLHATHQPGPPREFQIALSGRVLRCPWHGWEFDVVTGKGLYDEIGRVATFAVEVDEQGVVYVVL